VTRSLRRRRASSEGQERWRAVSSPWRPCGCAWRPSRQAGSEQGAGTGSFGLAMAEERPISWRMRVDEELAARQKRFDRGDAKVAPRVVQRREARIALSYWSDIRVTLRRMCDGCALGKKSKAWNGMFDLRQVTCMWLWGLLRDPRSSQRHLDEMRAHGGGERAGCSEERAKLDVYIERRRRRSALNASGVSKSRDRSSLVAGRA